MHILKKMETMANGKIVLCDFKALEPKNFSYFPHLSPKTIILEQILISNDGKIYINKRFDASYKYLAGIFENLIGESIYTLDQFSKTYRAKFPGITLENIGKMEGTDAEKNLAFAMLCIPAEKKRRQIEKAYFNKVVHI